MVRVAIPAQVAMVRGVSALCCLIDPNTMNHLLVVKAIPRLLLGSLQFHLESSILLLQFIRFGFGQAQLVLQPIHLNLKTVVFLLEMIHPIGTALG